MSEEPPLPFPHESGQNGPIVATLVDHIDVAETKGDEMGAIYLTSPDGVTTMLWKFGPRVGRQVAAAIMNQCDRMDGQL